MKKPSKVVFDTTVFDIGGRYPETTVSVMDILNEGAKDEVREELRMMAMILSNGNELSKGEAKWLGDALNSIARGEDANNALGLKRKRRITTQQLLNYRYLVNDLRKQGLSETDALEMVANYSHEDKAILDSENPDSDPAEALRQMLKRYKQKS